MECIFVPLLVLVVQVVILVPLVIWLTSQNIHCPAALEVVSSDSNSADSLDAMLY
jgi:hypothetical protein